MMPHGHPQQPTGARTDLEPGLFPIEVKHKCSPLAWASRWFNDDPESSPRFPSLIRRVAPVGNSGYGIPLLFVTLQFDCHQRMFFAVVFSGDNVDYRQSMLGSGLLLAGTERVHVAPEARDRDLHAGTRSIKARASLPAPADLTDADRYQ
jgi:hypothetical protein